MIFCGIARIIAIVVGVVYIANSQEFEGTPANRVTLWSMIYVALYLDSFALIHLFNINSITKSSDNIKTVISS